MITRKAGPRKMTFPSIYSKSMRKIRASRKVRQEVSIAHTLIKKLITEKKGKQKKLELIIKVYLV